jgi:hypothetical protein
MLAIDFDADGDSLSILSVGEAVGGEVSLADGVATFTPQAGFTGAATFAYTISDGNGGEDTGLVTVNVAPAAENPGEENPGEENPGEENPGEENPGEENPGEELPGEETPTGELPGEGTPEDPDHCETELVSQMRSRWLHLSRHWQ